ncbi:MAG: carboxypeptidase-like regulatory domain-containing protein, partial [Saprospiraceae bacterium]
MMKLNFLTKEKKHPIFLIVFLLLGMTSVSFGQTIQGTVSDDQNETLVGVNVVIKNTSTGTVTDFDGNFSLSVSELPTTLVFSYTGYKDREVLVSSADNSLAITLSSGVLLQDIIVTSRRVEESLQSVPLAITAFTPEELVQKGATQMVDVARFTPGLTIENGVSGAAFGTSIFIRGIGQSDFKGTTDPGVGVYVDGIYIARTIGTLFEMEGAQVEVLRGPQGTTFGRNTIGGAINITTP